MKKTISILLATILCIFSSAVITSATAEPVTSTVDIVCDGVEYTVEFEETTLSDEQQLIIAQRLLSKEHDGIETYGLICTLFGHDTEENVVSVITHKVRTTSPRCKRESYSVTTCTRCDYQEQELNGTSYIVCCPEE